VLEADSGSSTLVEGYDAYWGSGSMFLEEYPVTEPEVGDTSMFAALSSESAAQAGMISVPLGATLAPTPVGAA
jgi:hypothetical protein